MKITVFTSREFNQDYSKFTKAAKRGIVVITYHGRPRYVLMNYEDYTRGANGHLALPNYDDILLAIERSRKKK